MAVLTSSPSIKYTIPLTKYLSTRGQAIDDVGKYLGHCLWCHTFLMIPLTEVPCAEIHKLPKKQQHNLKSSERSPPLLYLLFVDKMLCFSMISLPKFLFFLALKLSKYMLVSLLDKQKPAP